MKNKVFFYARKNIILYYTEYYGVITYKRYNKGNFYNTDKVTNR